MKGGEKEEMIVTDKLEQVIGTDDEGALSDYFKSTFEQDLFINEYDLAGEWKKNGYLFAKWSYLAAYAEKEMARAELKMKEVKALVHLDVRQDPESYGWKSARGGAPTDDFVRAVVRTDEKFQKAQMEYQEAVKKHQIISSAKDSMSFQRKSALEGLTRLAIFKLLNSNPQEDISRVLDRVI